MILSFDYKGTETKVISWDWEKKVKSIELFSIYRGGVLVWSLLKLHHVKNSLFRLNILGIWFTQ